MSSKILVSFSCEYKLALRKIGTLHSLAPDKLTLAELNSRWLAYHLMFAYKDIYKNLWISNPELNNRVQMIL